MCGISAVAGTKPALPFLADSIKKLEYRGYDSYGVAVFDGPKLEFCKKDVGPASKLVLPTGPVRGGVGIAHVRWATNGEPSVKNAHPVAGGMRLTKAGKQLGYPPEMGGLSAPNTWVVHNGIIRNYQALRKVLEEDGYVFQTDTDTEVIAHLISRECSKNGSVSLSWLLIRVTSLLIGEYAFVAVSKNAPDTILFACNGAPLLITATGRVVSEASALAGHEEVAYRLSRGQVGYAGTHVTPVVFDSATGQKVTRLEAVRVPNRKDSSTEESHPHQMLKEIYEQPKVFSAKRTREVKLHALNERVLFGCGSSYNAALLCRRTIERVTGVRTWVEYASEFEPLGRPCAHTNFVAITQSGETKDVLNVMEEIAGQYPDHLTVVTNSAQSSAAALTKNRVFLNAGPEYGVAATKTFTATCLALLELVGTRLDREDLCSATEQVFRNEFIKDVSYSLVAKYPNVLFLGSGDNYAVAREGALKLKEVSYIHAEALPAAEMKHGPIALIDEDTLCVFIVGGETPKQGRVLSNMHEVRARGGQILCVTDGSVEGVDEVTDYVILHDQVHPWVQPILSAVVLQLIAYHAAVSLGINPDRPRSLAKTVTVE